MVITLLALNEKLRSFLPIAVDRARALGVSRETVASWDRKHVTERVRGDNVRRLERAVGVCESASQFLSTSGQVGLWLKAPQTFLYGGTPLDFLGDDGDADFLVENIPAPVTRVRESTRELHGRTRSAVAALVAPAPARQRRVTQAQASGRRTARQKQGRAAEQRLVVKDGDGWVVRKPGAQRASARLDTQREAHRRAAEILRNAGGGERITHGVDGRIRSKDTIAPGNDPYPPRDRQQ